MKYFSVALAWSTALLGACSPMPAARTYVPQCIGSATIAVDGTVTLQLIARGPKGEIGHGVITYPPSHPQYREIIDHLGGLAVGDVKCVPPWPDR